MIGLKNIEGDDCETSHHRSLNLVTFHKFKYKILTLFSHHLSSSGGNTSLYSPDHAVIETNI